MHPQTSLLHLQLMRPGGSSGGLSSAATASYRATDEQPSQLPSWLPGILLRLHRLEMRTDLREKSDSRRPTFSPERSIKVCEGLWVRVRGWGVEDIDPLNCKV